MVLPRRTARVRQIVMVRFFIGVVYACLSGMDTFLNELELRGRSDRLVVIFRENRRDRVKRKTSSLG